MSNLPQDDRHVLRAILITESPEEGDALEAALTDRPVPVLVQAKMERLPGSDVLERVLRRCKPDVAFVSFASEGRGVAITRHLEAQNVGLAIVAVHASPAPDEQGQASQHAIMAGVRAGAKEFLVAPFPDVDQVLERVAQRVSAHPPVYPTFQPIYSFLPAKPGVGASTLAVNLAAALAKLSADGPVLLGDLDLNSGMLRFLLGLRNSFSVTEALEHDNIGDEGLWPHLVSRCGEKLDVLHSGEVNPNVFIDPSKVDRLLDYVERSYVATCLDLSANLEQYALAVLERSRRIFLVTTTEKWALRAAQEKAEFLRGAGLASRVQVLLNRAGAAPVMDISQVEETVGFPVAHSFANDYSGVNQAIEQGRALPDTTPFGQQCREFAGELLNIKLEEKPPVKHGLLGFLGSRLWSKEVAQEADSTVAANEAQDANDAKDRGQPVSR